MKYIPSEAQTLIQSHLSTSNIAALFVGCGIGKTAAVLHALYNKFCDGATKGVLIVAPLRVCNITWPSEVQAWSDTLPGIKVANLRTREGWRSLLSGSSDLYLINYEQLQQLRDKYLSKLKRPEDCAFDTVVYDELTKAKNHNSKRINSVRPYFRKLCKRHWGMTGTPAPDKLLDIFAQIRLLDGGERLGRSFNQFRSTYFHPTDYNEYNWEPNEGARERIYGKIKDICLTLKSSDWLNIPDISEIDIDISLDKEQAKLYKKLQEDMLLELDEDSISAVNAAVLVNKLLQLTSGASYIDEQYGDNREKPWKLLHNIKLEALKKLVKSIDGPVLIAYQFRHEVTRILEAVPGAVSFNDAKGSQEQQDIVERWNNGDIPVLCAHPKSVAHGLNMQKGGNNLVWFSPTWSREDYDQMNARLARRGQDCVTNVYRLLVKDSIDTSVIEALRKKDEEQSRLINALKILKNFS